MVKTEEKTLKKKFFGKDKPKETETKKPEPSYDEILDLLKRTQANLENYRKQTEKRMTEIREFARKDVILKFIPVLDSLDLAMSGISKCDSPEMKEGMELIQKQLLSTLNDLDVEKIETKGEFNPLLHEALSQIPSEENAGTILSVFQPGYKLDGMVLRAARVQVSAGPKEDERDETKTEEKQTGNQE